MNKKVQLLVGNEFETFAGKISIENRGKENGTFMVTVRNLKTNETEKLTEPTLYNRIYRYMRHEQREQGVSPEERMERIEEKLDMILEILQKGGTP